MVTFIVGGSESVPGDWPWAALLGRVENNNKFKVVCGGSLITNKHVLTAAHCFPDNPTSTQVRIIL